MAAIQSFMAAILTFIVTTQPFMVAGSGGARAADEAPAMQGALRPRAGTGLGIKCKKPHNLRTGYGIAAYAMSVPDMA
eukprot:841794-Rhodomonas_salina.1